VLPPLELLPVLEDRFVMTGPELSLSLSLEEGESFPPGEPPNEERNLRFSFASFIFSESKYFSSLSLSFGLASFTGELGELVERASLWLLLLLLLLLLLFELLLLLETLLLLLLLLLLLEVEEEDTGLLLDMDVDDVVVDEEELVLPMITKLLLFEPG